MGCTAVQFVSELIPALGDVLAQRLTREASVLPPGVLASDYVGSYCFDGVGAMIITYNASAGQPPIVDACNITQPTCIPFDSVARHSVTLRMHAVVSFMQGYASQTGHKVPCCLSLQCCVRQCVRKCNCLPSCLVDWQSWEFATQHLPAIIDAPLTCAQCAVAIRHCNLSTCVQARFSNRYNLQVARVVIS